MFLAEKCVDPFLHVLTDVNVEQGFILLVKSTYCKHRPPQTQESGIL